MTSIDDRTMQRLALIKQLYIFANERSKLPTTMMNSILSVIGYDLAVENALRLAITYLNPSVRVDTDRTFPKLVQQAEDELSSAAKGSLPSMGRIQALHHIRNDAQHNGRYPSEEEVLECKYAAKEFLTGVIRQVWDEDFEAISLISLLKSPISRKFLEDAERYLEESDYDNSLKHSNAAISYALMDASELMFPESKHRLFKSMGLIKWNIGLASSRSAQLSREIEQKIGDIKEEMNQRSAKIESELDTLREQVKHELDSIEEPLLFTMLNLSYSEQLRFRSIAGTVRFHGRNHDFEVKGAKDNIQRDEAEAAFSYCVNSITQIEAAVFGARVAFLREKGQI